MPDTNTFMRVGRIATFVTTMLSVTLIGCANLSAPSGPEVTLSLHVQQSSLAGLRLRASVSGREIEVTATNAATSETAWHGLQFGAVPVRVALLNARGDTLATAAFTHHFEREHLHWIAASVGSHRPLGHCIGSLVPAPLAASSTDTLFVMYGRLPKGAVC